MKLRTNLPPETDDIFMITNTDSIWWLEIFVQFLSIPSKFIYPT
jgi:hypothetical protein